MNPFITLLRRNHNYRNTWIGQVVSEIGDHFNNIAVFGLVLAQTHNGMVVTGVMLARAIPANATTSASDSMRAATLADVRRGACSRLSAASAPSTGRSQRSSGRIALARPSERTGPHSSAAVSAMA